MLRGGDRLLGGDPVYHSQPNAKGVVLKKSIIPLGKPVSDTATGLKGALTHAMFADAESRPVYHFQPKRLDITGSPLPGMWIPQGRVLYDGEPTEIEVPLAALGTMAIDEVTGYCGVIVEICLHISGCVHALIQSAFEDRGGRLAKAFECDTRRLKGPGLSSLSPEQRAVEETAKPSPAFALPFHPSSTPF